MRGVPHYHHFKGKDAKLQALPPWIFDLLHSQIYMDSSHHLDLGIRSMEMQTYTLLNKNVRFLTDLGAKTEVNSREGFIRLRQPRFHFATYASAQLWQMFWCSSAWQQITGSYSCNILKIRKRDNKVTHEKSFRCCFTITFIKIRMQGSYFTMRCDKSAPLAASRSIIFQAMMDKIVPIK